MMKVVWSDNAKYDYWQNIDYLENYWTYKEVEKFLEKVDIIVKQLEKGTVVFKPTQEKDIFKLWL